ncbi:Cell death protease [Entomortierella lignicola]|nr:Cell death protease [Entomortierella lignicola]
MRATSLAWLAVTVFSQFSLLTIVRAQVNADDYLVRGLPDLSPEDADQLKQYAGHIALDADKESHLFFWMAASKQTQESSKLIIWLNGVDQPIGTGLSYSSKQLLGTLEEVTDNFLSFLKEFFAIFPERAQDDLYLAGESYAGTYIPYFAKGIIDHNEQLPQGHISYNLKGIAIGNGWIDPLSQYTSYIPYVVQHGLASPELLAELVQRQDQCLDDIRLHNRITQNKCEDLVTVILDDSAKGPTNSKCINQYDIRLKDEYPYCGLLWPYELPQMKAYLSRRDVREALHATSVIGDWQECNMRVNSALRFDDSQPSVTLLPDVLEKIEVMLYSGEQDLICNHIGTEYLISNLTWQGEKGYQNALDVSWTVDEKPAGIWRQERNLTYVLFYNASHMVPYDTPLAALDMMNRFMGLDTKRQSFTSKLDTDVDSELPPGGEKVEIDQPRESFSAGSMMSMVVLVGVVASIYVIMRHNRKQRRYGSSRNGAQWFPLDSSRPGSGGHQRVLTDELDELVVESGIHSDEENEDEEYRDGAFDIPDPALNSPFEQRH